MTELLLIRHGQPLSGAADPGLSPAGSDQAERLGQWLAGERIDTILTSPMARAHQTAEIAARRLGMPITASLDDLREWDKDNQADGNYVAVENLGSDNPRGEALRTGRYEEFVPAMDRAAFRARARGVLDEILRQWPGQRVAAFSHGGLINAVLAGVLGLEEKLFFFLPDYTSVSTLREMPGGRRVIQALNLSAHLDQRFDPEPALRVATRR